MSYLAFWIFQVLLVFSLVWAAKSSRNKCRWNVEQVKRKLAWGIFIVVFVQIADLYKELTLNKGLGIFYHIQWIGVYWIALAVDRKSVV